MASDTQTDESISVQALRVGMFVRLDSAWITHPFPLNNFKIGNPEQIATIRALGVASVRWDPSLSDNEAPSTAPGLTAAPVQAVAPAPAAAPAQAVTPTPAAALAQAVAPATPAAAPFVGAAAVPRAQRLARQREAQAECESRFTNSVTAGRQAAGRIASDPERAKVEFESLTKSLLGEIVTQEDICISLIRDAVGNNASTHAQNVAVLALLLGRKFGLSQAELLDLGMGALLHDIGKIGIAERLHHPDEYFTALEIKAYEEHVAFGLVRGQQMGLSAGVMQIIAQHHEMADGSGFPLKLGSERMGHAARIVAMVNAFDTLCNPQVSKRAVTPHEALAQMFTQGKRRFDTSLLGAFIKLIGVYPAGTTVQLTDERLAVVISVNSAHPLKPRVLVHDVKVPREEALVIDIGDEPGLGIRRSIKPQHLPVPALHYLAPRQRMAYYFDPVLVEPAA